MTQGTPVATVVHVRATSFLLAALGFLLLAIGELPVSWFPAGGSLEFALQTLGPVLIAVGLIIKSRTFVTRWGASAVIFYVLALLFYAAVWFPYALNPESLGTVTATHRGFFTQGIGFICAAVATFMVMRSKEARLEHPADSREPHIKATFMQLLLIGLGCLINGFSWTWLAQEDTKMAVFFLPVVGCVIVLIAVISCRALITAQVGRPAAIFTILGVFMFMLHWALDMLPSWSDPDWHQSMRVAGIAFALGAVACVLAARRSSAAHHSS